MQLLITRTKNKTQMGYTYNIYHHEESTANRIILLYFVELVCIATPTNWFCNFTINRNPSSGSLVISETGSLDRTKSSGEKRKKGTLDDEPRVSDRVEVTRVNPNVLIDEIWKDTKLDQLAESAESEWSWNIFYEYLIKPWSFLASGLQLYIARDGTASLGGHEVKSNVRAGAFKQVVMQDRR